MSAWSLFDEPAGSVRASDPETSRAAARSISAWAEEAVMRAHRVNPPGLTDDELVELVQSTQDLYGPTLKSARSRLAKRGLLVDTGERALSNRGRSMIVWARP